MRNPIRSTTISTKDPIENLEDTIGEEERGKAREVDKKNNENKKKDLEEALMEEAARKRRHGPGDFCGKRDSNDEGEVWDKGGQRSKALWIDMVGLMAYMAQTKDKGEGEGSFDINANGECSKNPKKPVFWQPPKDVEIYLIETSKCCIIFFFKFDYFLLPVFFSFGFFVLIFV